MSETHAEPAQEPTQASAVVAAGPAVTPASETLGITGARRAIMLQRSIGNAATTRLIQRAPGLAGRAGSPVASRQLQRQPHQAAAKTGDGSGATAGPVATATAQTDFKPFVPAQSVDRLFEVGAQVIKQQHWRIDHIAVIAGAVYVASAAGQRVANYTLRGNFSLEPGVYIVDGLGTLRFGYRAGKLTSIRVGWRTENLPPDLRKLAADRQAKLKSSGKAGPTIFMHDWIDMTEAQEEGLGNTMFFVLEPTKQDDGDAEGKPGAQSKGGDGAQPPGQTTKPPALADQRGFGSDFGTPGGKRADLPRFPARIRPMSSLRGGVVKPPDGTDGAALPFVYQPVRGAATYVMEIDYTMASPGYLLGQAAAASRLHHYRWELWDITQSHSDALDEGALNQAAQQAARNKPGSGRTVKATDAAKQDLATAGAELARRPQQYDEDERRAIAERRYFDALAGEVNKELVGLEVMFKYGKEILGMGSDAMGVDRERRVPIPTEGVFLLRCLARYDPYADREGRPTRAPSSATIIIKVKPADVLSRDALSEGEASISDIELAIKVRTAAIAQLKQTGGDASQLEAELATLNRQREEAVSRNRDLPVALLERQLADKEKALAKAQSESELFKAGYADMDTNLRQLTKERDELRKQLGHARTQAASLTAGDSRRLVHRLAGNLVSRVTGQTYPLLLQANDPKEDTPGNWSCRLADATSPSGKYYDGRGSSAVAALGNAVDALAGDNLEGYGEGSLSVRVPAAGKFADATEAARTFARQTRPRDWAAARQRLDELATILGLLALVAVPGAGEVAMALGAALAAARILERVHNDSLYWDPELVSDIIAILSAVTAATTAVGNLRIINDGKKFAIVTVEEASRVGKAAQKFNDWFLDPLNIAWGNYTLITQLRQISEQELTGQLTATEARRKRADTMAAAINTNLTLLGGKVAGAVHETNASFEKPGTRGEQNRRGGTKKDEATGKKNETAGQKDETAGRKDETTGKKDETTGKKDDGGTGQPQNRPAGTDAPPERAGGLPLPIPGPGGHAAPEVAPRAAFRDALTRPGEPPVAEARRVILELRDWKGELRNFVQSLPEAQRARAMEALAEARQALVKEVTDEAAAAFGAVQRNWGTPGFGSDIDLTITPKERIPGFVGPERPIADQIRAAADAGDFINRKLRERLGSEPDRAIDTNVYSYIAEDRVVLGTAEVRGRAGALEAEIGLAEAHRGVDQATWDALRTKLGEKLAASDPATQRALADLTARMDRGAATEAELRAEMERAQATLTAQGVPADRVAVAARDQILADKKRRLATLFEKPRTADNTIAILRLQAEIRWFAPDAYAGGAAFDYAVGFGQARRSAGVDAAAAGGRETPTRADVLADLAANWAREQNRPEELRMALYAAAATSQLGMLGAHVHGKPADQVKAAAKYAARILDLLGYSRLGGDQGIIPTALANFVRGRWPEVPDGAKTQMLVRYAMDTGMWGGIIRGPDGKATGVSDEVMRRFVTEAQVWALDATARLMVGERTHSGAVADPATPSAGPAKPGVPAGPEGQGSTGPAATDTPTAPSARVGAGSPDPVAGALRGNTYELGNTYQYRDSAGAVHEAGGLERKTGAEKVSRALDRLPDLDAGASIQAIAKHSLQFDLTVPSTGGGGALSVPVEVVIKKAADLTPGAHGADSGPARLIPSATRDAAGARVWRARIEVDSRVFERDLPHVLRHETNELIALIRTNAGEDPKGGFESQMAAGVMRPDAAPGPVAPTAHDRAAVLELKELYADLDRQKAGTPAFDKRVDSIERASQAMGLDVAVNVREKLRMLREAGLPAEAINRLAQAAGAELGAAHRAREAAAGRAGSIFDDALATKTLVPRDLGSFKADGLNGGHVTAHLIDFCAFTPFHVNEVGHPRIEAGTVWRRFEQWKWLGALKDKPTRIEELPGGASFDASKWQRSDQPKTTADDAAILLRESESAWRNWFGRHNGGPGSVDDRAVTGAAGRAFGGPSGLEPARSDAGVEFAGFYDPAPGGATVRTVFVDQSWLP